MPKEQWIQWDPTPKKEIYRHIYFERKGQLLSIYLQTHMLDFTGPTFVFKNGIEAYRMTNESYRLKTMHDLSSTIDDDFYTEWSFFKVENSQFIADIVPKESTQNYTHFVFSTEDEFFEVIASYDPVASCRQ